MKPETRVIGYVGRNEIAIEQFRPPCVGYTFEGSDYDFTTEKEAREAALDRDVALCKEQDERWEGKA